MKNVNLPMVSGSCDQLIQDDHPARHDAISYLLVNTRYDLLVRSVLTKLFDSLQSFAYQNLLPPPQA